MRTDFYYKSQCGSKIHGCRWTPDGEVKAIVQIIHGISEYTARYNEFAEFLNSQGIQVVAEDHMGHGLSVTEKTPRVYFCGGWFGAVEDTYKLTKDTMAEFPGVPYFIYGHSMGSFMARTILARYPDSGISGAIICGTGWQSPALITAAKSMAQMICKIKGDTHPSKLMRKMAFGSYNDRIEHLRTPLDWLSRDPKSVDAYIADPLCGGVASAGLMGDMMDGFRYIQDPQSLVSMDPDLPVFFIAGDADPVGDYGKGVRYTAEMFREAGMKQVDVKIYPLCRHEVHNELNKAEVHQDVLNWMSKVMVKSTV